MHDAVHVVTVLSLLYAVCIHVCAVRVEDVRKATEQVGGLPKECKGLFLEVGCLFVINQGSVEAM